MRSELCRKTRYYIVSRHRGRLRHEKLIGHIVLFRKCGDRVRVQYCFECQTSYLSFVRSIIVYLMCVGTHEPVAVSIVKYQTRNVIQMFQILFHTIPLSRWEQFGVLCC